jgi:hypothetical protein
MLVVESHNFATQRNKKNVKLSIVIKLYDTIYLLTAIGLTTGGSSTVHIYTHKQYTERHNETEYPERYTTRIHKKCKAIPLQTWTGPEGSRRLRLPDFTTIGTWRWWGCQPYAPVAFTPLIISIKNSNDTIGNRTRDLPTCNAVPHPTAPPRTPNKNT